jgi:hypothetical protein
LNRSPAKKRAPIAAKEESVFMKAIAMDSRAGISQSVLRVVLLGVRSLRQLWAEIYCRSVF